MATRCSWMTRVLAVFAGGLAAGLTWTAVPAAAQTLNAYCHISQEEAERKEELRQAAFGGDVAAQRTYQQLVQQHAQQLQNCRRQSWPNQQAVWVRLYPCDLQPGILDAVMDRIVNLGYNAVHVEVFYGGQVLLPAADNPTVWPSVVDAPGYERRDLLAEAITKGRERGMRVYSWLFTLNFGYSYGQRPDRQGVLARNGRGQDTLTFAKAGGSGTSEEVFVDPYNPQAQMDYRRVVEATVRRRPDGLLFDYVRYPRGVGPHSVVTQVDDLWIYGDASRNALMQRALNNSGRELIRRYISRGRLLTADLEELTQLYPNEAGPLWQSLEVSPDFASRPVDQRRQTLQNELWRLVVAHAAQGIIGFLDEAARPVQRQGLPTGAVFFPNANRTVGSGGFDSRLQYWDRFSRALTWHPMAYGVCGHTGCILDEVRRVLDVAGGGQGVQPALAGIWGRATYNRPALEVQMQALRQAAPQLSSVSHFAYSWQDPEFDRVRKFCRLP